MSTVQTVGITLMISGIISPLLALLTGLCDKHDQANVFDVGRIMLAVGVAVSLLVAPFLK